jgi:hypothetical protein
MFSQYGGTKPEGKNEPGVNNHDGYLNPNTADSYTEGFAEFMAMAISKYKLDKHPEIYAGFGSLEINYKAWSNRGYTEELAVAGILWDMYDNENDDGDKLTLELNAMWDVMKVKRDNFYEYYKAFKVKFPDNKDEIDKLFTAHGFFADNKIGNKIRDDFEPFKDSNNNKIFDNNESFVDYGDLPENIKYVDGKTIGQSTNYGREKRYSAVRIPNAYLKVNDNKVRMYDISVKSSGMSYTYQSDVRNGLLYVQPLPEEIDAEILVKPSSSDYASENEFKINSKELTKKILSTQDKGYFAEQDFKLKPTGKKEDPKYELFNDIEPIYEVTNIDSKEESSKTGIINNSNQGLKLLFKLPWAIIAIAGLMLIVLVFFLRKKR